MIVSVRCQHCGNKVQVEDMGDNCICPACHRYIISISEFVREEIKRNYKGMQDEQANQRTIPFHTGHGSRISVFRCVWHTEQRTGGGSNHLSGGVLLS